MQKQDFIFKKKKITKKMPCPLSLIYHLVGGGGNHCCCMKTPDQDMAPACRDSLEQEQGEISWACLGMLRINLCIYSHLETYTILVENLLGKKFMKLLIKVFKIIKITV